jgi:hypothetical protein
VPIDRETIFTALHARLSALPATAPRGDEVPELVPAAGFLILRDGELGKPEVTLLPLHYNCQHLAEIEMVVQRPPVRRVRPPCRRSFPAPARRSLQTASWAAPATGLRRKRRVWFIKH